MRGVPWKTVAGYVIHVLIAGMMIMAGAMKLMGRMPPEVVEKMPQGVRDNLSLIGAGELLSAVLLLIPRTHSLGLLLVSGFWGGVIATHMVQGEGYVPWAVALALTWAGAYLRDPRTFASFGGPWPLGQASSLPARETTPA